MKAVESTNNREEGFLVKHYWGRPCYLWGWSCLIIGAFLVLLLGLMVDQLTTATIKVASGSGEDVFHCGSYEISSATSGFSVDDYSKDCELAENECKKQGEAGEAWVGLNIMAVLFYIPLLFGLVRDLYAARWDAFGFPCIPDVAGHTIGLTLVSFIFVIFWSFVALLAYSDQEQCTTKKMWERLLGAINKFEAIGGASLAFAAIALILHFFAIVLLVLTKLSVGTLPQGEEKEFCIKLPEKSKNPEPQLQTYNNTTTTTSQPTPNVPPPVPQSKPTNPPPIPQPKPTGPPPVPQPKPNGPPPVPPKN